MGDFDFGAPEHNEFLCMRELWVKDNLYRRRADITGFVNGLPLSSRISLVAATVRGQNSIILASRGSSVSG
ncbi:type I restriction endonuclease [Acidithiobacillus sp.]|uniref:type I restriction endonuclease n=2 Tax=Acidithiobacillus TaxID=119977 RepID=UPI0025826A90|nr:type I restriction endonuclease [Acidithiobacillus sp.]